jgi:serine protease AprX
MTPRRGAAWGVAVFPLAGGWTAVLLITLSFALQAVSGRAAELSPDLEERVRTSAPGTMIPVIVRLRGRVDAREIDRESRRNLRGLRPRRARLVRELRAQAETPSYRGVRGLLGTRGGTRIRELWAINALAAELPADLVSELSGRPEVESIRLDATIAEPPTRTAMSTSMSVTARWNLEAVGAPQLWQLGWTGQGGVVATLDSGVDPLHPDLAPAWRGGANSWFDPYGENASPHDVSGHGTQVMGLIVGGDNSGDTIGMAPGASWIAAKIFDNSGVATLSGIHASLQWVLDPDADSGTDDAPDIVNNSWSLLNSAGDCDLEFQDDLDALRVAEIVVVFSAGNSGPSPSTSMSPGDNPTVHFATGTVDSTLLVDSSSAQGPSACTAGYFPHVVAPGVAVETTNLTFGGLIPNSYLSVDGSSFAAPHVTGAFALLKSAVPDATLDELEAAVEQTTLDLGVPGPDDQYGAGLIDVPAAYTSLSGGGGFPVPALSGPGFAVLVSLLVGTPLSARRLSRRTPRASRAPRA